MRPVLIGLTACALWILLWCWLLRAAPATACCKPMCCAECRVEREKCKALEKKLAALDKKLAAVETRLVEFQVWAEALTTWLECGGAK